MIIIKPSVAQTKKNLLALLKYLTPSCIQQAPKSYAMIQIIDQTWRQRISNSSGKYT